jgi:Fe-S-cluster containining protein
MSPTYDCQTCGACCGSPWTGDGYVTLSDEEVDRLQKLALPIVWQRQGDTEPIELIPRLGTRIAEDGRRTCVAFQGTVGQTCGCGIYEARPGPCRRYQAGDVLCLEARRRAGQPIHGE